MLTTTGARNLRHKQQQQVGLFANFSAVRLAGVICTLSRVMGDNGGNTAHCATLGRRGGGGGPNMNSNTCRVLYGRCLDQWLVGALLTPVSPALLYTERGVNQIRGNIHLNSATYFFSSKVPTYCILNAYFKHSTSVYKSVSIYFYILCLL